MEPREYWDRNSALAEAFCACDEKVREAQALLDERQVERSRTLAAFAVTVGDDGTVANLMGLGEREVRLARRTVGKTDAREVAQELLARTPQAIHRELGEAPRPAALQAPEQAEPPALAQSVHAPPQEPQAVTEPVPTAVLPHQRRESLAAPPQDPQPLQEPDAEGAVQWSPSMDSVLVWSWRSNLDLHTVAAELGLDLRTLLLRTQTLAQEGRLGAEYEAVPEPPHVPHGDDAQQGRHRRHYTEGYATFAHTAFPAYA
ncbi:hypothetical protein AB0910_11725 [Streptomyces sp. NPDC047002]|uniref:hypothetical protein n=1 Tax=Streptomyces sp. NPDC047002 TaxID=3155475 RepID=UPI003454FBD6